MADELSIYIGANTKDLTKALKKAQNDLDKFKDKVTPVGDGLEKTSGKSLAAASSIRNLTGALKGGDASLSNVAESALEAGDALLNAKQGASSVQKATMGLSGAMTGALAVSLLTAGIALTKYVFRLSDAAKQSQKLIDSTKKLIGGAKAELTTYTALLAVAKDETRSKEDRERALVKVNEQSGKYIGNLKLEGINSSKTAGLTDKYSESLLQNAKIKGLQSRLSELYAKQFDIENRQLEQNTTWYEKAGAGLASYATGQGAAGAASYITTQGLKNQQKELSGVNDQITKLTSSLTGLVGKDVGEGGIFTSPKKQEEEIKQIRNHSANILGALLQAKEVIKPVTDELSASLAIAPTEIGTAAAQTRMDNMLLMLDNFNTQAGELIQGSIGETFAGIGEAIGGALAAGGNVLSAVGGAILNGIGKFLGQLGGMMIKYGVALKAYAIASKAALNPLTALPAAGGMIAAGVALKAVSGLIGGVIKKGASGGGGGGASISGGGSRGGSFGGGGSTGGGSFNQGGGTVVFEIQGQKLIGVLSNTLTRNRALGGSLNITTG